MSIDWLDGLRAASGRLKPCYKIVRDYPEGVGFSRIIARQTFVKCPRCRRLFFLKSERRLEKRTCHKFCEGCRGWVKILFDKQRASRTNAKKPIKTIQAAPVIPVPFDDSRPELSNANKRRSNSWIGLRYPSGALKLHKFRKIRIDCPPGARLSRLIHRQHFKRCPRCGVTFLIGTDTGAKFCKTCRPHIRLLFFKQRHVLSTALRKPIYSAIIRYQRFQTCPKCGHMFRPTGGGVHKFCKLCAPLVRRLHSLQALTLSRLTLSDAYLANMLGSQVSNIRSFPEELKEIKRQQITLSRMVRDIKQKESYEPKA